MRRYALLADVRIAWQLMTPEVWSRFATQLLNEVVVDYSTDGGRTEAGPLFMCRAGSLSFRRPNDASTDSIGIGFAGASCPWVR